MPFTYISRTTCHRDLVDPLKCSQETCFYSCFIYHITFRPPERHRLFLSERIHSNEVNMWSRLPKAQLKMWKTGDESKIIKTEIIELTEDRALFGRMAFISKNRSAFDS